MSLTNPALVDNQQPFDSRTAYQRGANRPTVPALLGASHVLIDKSLERT